MAKVSSPLISLGGSGTIGKAVTFGSWRGVRYARQHVVPANPNTSEQQTTRAVFRWVGEFWAYSPAAARAPWLAFVRGKPLTDRNAQIKFLLPPLRNATDLSNLIASPPVLGGPAPANMTVTTGTGSGELTATLTPETLPTGWVVTRAQFIALPNQDPHDLFVGPIVYAEDTTTPYSVTLSGLPSAQSCAVAGWFEYARDDGRMAYGTNALIIGTSGA